MIVYFLNKTVISISCLKVLCIVIHILNSFVLRPFMSRSVELQLFRGSWWRNLLCYIWIESKLTSVSPSCELCIDDNRSIIRTSTEPWQAIGYANGTSAVSNPGKIMIYSITATSMWKKPLWTKRWEESIFLEWAIVGIGGRLAHYLSYIRSISI